MSNLDTIIRELTVERDRLNRAIEALTSIGGSSRPQAAVRQHKFSPAALAKMRAAQRARRKRERAGSAGPKPKKRQISAAGLARIRAAQRARWAKVRAGKK
jgi:hypothetical protein